MIKYLLNNDNNFNKCEATSDHGPYMVTNIGLILNDFLFDSPEECYQHFLAEKLTQIENLKESVKKLSVAYNKFMDENNLEINESSFNRKFQ